MMLRTCSSLLLAVALVAGFGVPRAAAQIETTTTATCTLHNNLYTCDKAAFERVLAGAKTAAIETGTTDALAQQRLKKLVADLGKTPVPRGEHADITFLLVPVDPSGVEYNTNSAQLATLRVFAAQPDQAGRGALVWAENYTGDIDLQWPAIVNQLVSKFRKDFSLPR